MSESDFLRLHSEVREQNAARLDAARKRLLDEGYVFERLRPGQFVSAAATRELQEGCYDAKGRGPDERVQLQIFVRRETRLEPDEVVSATLDHACDFFRGSQGSLWVSHEDGRQRQLERIIDENALLARAPTGELFTVQEMPRTIGQRRVKVRCEDREPQVRETALSRGFPVPFHWAPAPRLPKVELAYDYEELVDECG